MILPVQGRDALSGRKLALDVMSGDESPRSRIRAALRSLEKYPGLHLVLVGDQVLIESMLKTAGYDVQRVQIVHAEKTVAMGQKPSRALRGKKGTSMWLALELVARGDADACVSAGNTGALMAMGRFALKTFAGIDRPAITTSIPSQNGSALLLDMGANVDCTSSHLYQFAVMGSQLASSVKGIPHPKIGLLNVGTEDIKGNEQVRLAHQLLQGDARLNYTGYVEGHDIFSGKVDVIVCDGFAGNIALKTGEGAASLIRQQMIELFEQTLWRRFLALLISPMLRQFYRQIDPVLYNGASLLGLQGTVVKSHGGADEQGFYHAICQAVSEVDNDVPRKLACDIEAMMNHL